MKVLFLQNLEHHKLGDVKEIPDGYARNFLIPKGIAVPATDEKIAELEAKKVKLEKEEEKVLADLTALAEKIESQVFSVEVQAGEDNRLFGAVTNRDIAEAMAKKKIEIEKQDIEILEPIHELGEHEALAKLGHGVHATIKVNVERAQ